MNTSPQTIGSQLVVISLDDLRTIVEETVVKTLARENRPKRREGFSDEASNEYVFGAKDIAIFFGVSQPTVRKYLGTFLKDAKIKIGRRIGIHKGRAMALYEKEAERQKNLQTITINPRRTYSAR